MIFLAHAGHDHEPPIIPPAHTTSTTEPVLSDQPYPAATITSNATSDLLIGGGTLIGLIIFWLLATYVFKLKLATRFGIAMTVLLVVGVAGYQHAPITSTVALTLGISLTIVTVLAQLGTKRTADQSRP